MSLANRPLQGLIDIIYIKTEFMLSSNVKDLGLLPNREFKVDDKDMPVAPFQRLNYIRYQPLSFSSFVSDSPGTKALNGWLYTCYLLELYFLIYPYSTQ